MSVLISIYTDPHILEAELTFSVELRQLYVQSFAHILSFSLRPTQHIMSHQLVVTLIRIGCKLLYKIGKAHVDPFRKVTIVNVWTQ